jgi:hypothetical protein
MKMFTNGWAMVRNACGKMTFASDWVNAMPMARVASAWPTGTVLIPPRTVSQANDPETSARQMTAVVYSENETPTDGKRQPGSAGSTTGGCERARRKGRRARNGGIGLTRNSAITRSDPFGGDSAAGPWDNP